jgi:hypothetical protein
MTRLPTLHDLSYATEAQAHHGSDSPVGHPSSVGGSDGLIASLVRPLVPLDRPAQRLRVIGHKSSVENLTPDSNACRFIHMKSYQITTQADTRSKSRQTRTWTIEAASEDDAMYQARMNHMSLLGRMGWEMTIWTTNVKEIA